jgi:S-adenosylmethionine hydrolase
MSIRRFRPGIAWLLLSVLMTGCNSAKSSSEVSAPAADSTPAQPLLCLFTDYGWDDAYVAQMKGAILTIDPDARLVDLNHTVSPFNVMEGSYLLAQSAAEFPAGTIFVAVVDPEVGSERDPVLVETAKNKFYLGPDNGLLTGVIDDEGLTGAWKLDKPAYFRSGGDSHTFHGRDIFGPVAAHLARGETPDTVGTPMPEKSLTLLPVQDPSFAGGTISVQVVHLDRFGNVILNLKSDSEFAPKLKEGNLVKITIGRESHAAPLVRTYSSLEKGRLCLLYNSGNRLEIAMNQGSAAKELNVEAGQVILLKP